MNGTIADRLRGKRRVFLNTEPLIYFIQKNETYHSLVLPVFQMIEEGQIEGLSSYITLLEVLVQPLREGREDIAREYRDTLIHADNFELIPLDEKLAEEGARVRARYPSFKTPDAIQLAAATLSGADAFLTNDNRLKRFDRLEILDLNDFVRDRPGS